MTQPPAPSARDATEDAVPTLYLCATPIGNLGDMTYRAVELLKHAALVAAEDTRRTRALFSHFDIHAPLTSYHEHNKREKGSKLIEWMQEGHDLVCVTDAGLPGICDPGSDLAARAIAAGLRVSPVPGANAALSALIASGLDTRRFTFVGFLPRAKKERAALLASVRAHKETLLFYEAPHHLLETLAALQAALGDRRAAIGRELTKRFEQFLRGTLSDLAAQFRQEAPRGECVLVVEGARAGAAGAAGAADEARPRRTPLEAYESYRADGHDKKEAMRRAAKELSLSRREVYQIVLAQEEAGKEA